MPRKGENIYKRKDGRWEGRYIKARSQTGKVLYLDCVLCIVLLYGTYMSQFQLQKCV